MWMMELEKFKCPYCGHEYTRYSAGCGDNYEYNGEIYSLVMHPCPKCEKSFFYGKDKDEFIKIPEDRSKLKFHSTWIS